MYVFPELLNINGVFVVNDPTLLYCKGGVFEGM